MLDTLTEKLSGVFRGLSGRGRISEENIREAMKDGSMGELIPSSLPKGARITVFYQVKTRKVDSKKIKYCEIFQLNAVK